MKLVKSILSLVILNLVCSQSFTHCPKKVKDLCFEIQKDGEGHKVTMKGPSDTGYMAIGLGKKMKGAEMFIGHFNNKGEYVVSFRKGTGHSLPEYQDDQSLISINQSESGLKGELKIVTFNILPNSGKSKDLKLDGTDNIIWAFSNKPFEGDKPDSKFKRHTDRGSFKY